MQYKPSVFLAECSSYGRKTLLDIVHGYFSLQHLAAMHSSTVLIKPNLISARFATLSCTEPRFITALCQYFVDLGATVIVGDSPAFGNASGVLKTLQIYDELKFMGVTVSNFSDEVKKELPCGVKIGVARAALDCDYFINAPKVKAHSQMYVTLGVKNIFGIVRGMQKSKLHMCYGDKSSNMFASILLELTELLPQNFTLIDGVVAMHRDGPLRGEGLTLGCVGCAEDPVALDTSMISVLRLQRDMSLLWQEAQARQKPGAEVNNIEFPWHAPERFHSVRFLAPEKLIPIRFNPLRFVWGGIKRLHQRING